MAERKEKEENSKAGRVILPELPPQQAGRESDKMQRAQVWEYQQSSLFLVRVALSWEGLQVPAALLPPKSRVGGWGFHSRLLTAVREELPVEAKGQNEQPARLRASVGLLRPWQGGHLCPGAGSGARAGSLPVTWLEPAPAGGVEGESCLSK